MLMFEEKEMKIIVEDFFWFDVNSFLVVFVAAFPSKLTLVGSFHASLSFTATGLAIG